LTTLVCQGREEAVLGAACAPAAQWCATGFTSQTDCNQANGPTDKLQGSPTATPVAGYDPSTSTIPQNTWTVLSQEPPFSPFVVMPAPVGTYARVAILEDVNPQNVGIVVQEAIDTEHNNSKFQWLQVTPLATINQCSPPANNACNELIQGQTQTMTISRTYAPARGIYAISNNGTSSVPDDATLLNSGTASPMPQLALIASQVNF